MRVGDLVRYVPLPGTRLLPRNHGLFGLIIGEALIDHASRPRLEEYLTKHFEVIWQSGDHHGRTTWIDESQLKVVNGRGQ